MMRCAVKHVGFPNAHERRFADRRTGPILLGCANDDHSKDIKDEEWKSLTRHPDEDQVQLDVNRSFIYYPDSPSFVLQHTSSLTTFFRPVTERA